jgi:putative transposase
VADITYVPTWVGFVYLAVVLDVFSRRIVGWSMRNDLKAELVVEALTMAVTRRQPISGAIHHSDHGSQYTSIAFGKRLRDAGLEHSLGSVGDCYDNALAESFFATLECELIDRRVFRTRTDARLEIFRWIEGRYNTRRRHSAAGRKSPAAFETDYYGRLSAEIVA